MALLLDLIFFFTVLPPALSEVTLKETLNLPFLRGAVWVLELRSTGPLHEEGPCSNTMEACS